MPSKRSPTGLGVSKGALCHSHVIPSPEFQTLEDSLGSGHCVLGDGKGSLPQLRPLPQLLQQQRGWDDKRYMMTHPQSSAVSGLWSSFLSRTMPGSAQMAALPGKPPQPWAGPETYPLSATCSLWYPKSPVTLLGLYSGNPICTPTHTPQTWSSQRHLAGSHTARASRNACGGGCSVKLPCCHFQCPHSTSEPLGFGPSSACHPVTCYAHPSGQ